MYAVGGGPGVAERDYAPARAVENHRFQPAGRRRLWWGELL